MKKYILGAVFAFSVLAAPAFTQAAALTNSQVQSILSLLTAFGADSTTIANVSAALGGTPTPMPLPSNGYSCARCSNVYNYTHANFTSDLGDCYSTTAHNTNIVYSCDASCGVVAGNQSYGSCSAASITTTTNSVQTTVTGPTVTGPTVSITSGINSAVISWTGVASGNFAVIRVGTNQNEVNSGCPNGFTAGCMIKLGDVNTNPGLGSSYTLTGLQPNTTYYYRVAAVASPTSYSVGTNGSFVTISTNPVPGNAPTVTFVGTPTLTLQYDSAGKEAYLVANATVKVTTGSSPINSPGLCVMSLTNNYLGIGTNSTRCIASPSVSAIPANTSATFTITNTAPTKELFAGSYTIFPSQFIWVDASGVYQTVQTFGFVAPNPVTIIGETSPYITSVTSDSSGIATILGARLTNLGQCQINLNGRTISSGSPDSTRVPFRPADFGITMPGNYQMQIINSVTGNSNIVTFTYTSSQPTPTPIPTPTTIPDPMVSLGPVDNDSAVISWSSGSYNLSGLGSYNIAPSYVVFRLGTDQNAVNSGCPNGTGGSTGCIVKLGDMNTNPNLGSSYAATGLTSGTTYYYRVANVSLNGSYSTGTNGSFVTAPTPNPTPTPTPNPTPTPAPTTTYNVTGTWLNGSRVWSLSQSGTSVYGTSESTGVRASGTVIANQISIYFDNGYHFAGTITDESHITGTQYNPDGTTTAWSLVRNGSMSLGGGTNQTASALNAFESATQPSSKTLIWNHDLYTGSPYASEIKMLQLVLTKEGLYTGDITGGFYAQTLAAVKAFQQKYGIDATGYVGSVTRAKLNALY